MGCHFGLALFITGLIQWNHFHLKTSGNNIYNPLCFQKGFQVKKVWNVILSIRNLLDHEMWRTLGARMVPKLNPSVQLLRILEQKSALSFFQNNLYVLLLPQPSLHSHQQGLNASVFKYFIKIKILERLWNSVYLSFCFGLFIVFFLQDNTMWSQRKKWEERGGTGAGKRPQAWIHTWVTRSAFCLPCRPSVLSPTGAVFFFFI